MEVVRVFDDKFQQLVQGDVKSVLLEGSDGGETEESPTSSGWIPDRSTSLACSYCRVEFDHVTQQRDHYKLDWHRYNLRQSLLQKPPISEEAFSDRTAQDDLSSISGSDTDHDDHTLDSYATAQGKIFLQNGAGHVFSMFTCLVMREKREVEATPAVISARIRECCVRNRKWAVLMLGGGHFAGAIFDAGDPIVHKTFHCYTVRAGQGGAQSSRDSKGGGGGGQPKSAGASLRRYNEQSLVQHVRGVMEAWRGQLEGCSLIVYRASGPYNRAVLFGGAEPLLEKGDRRLRTIPFSTRRATFTEVKRVHGVLTVAHVYESLESAMAHFGRQKKPEVGPKRNRIDRARSRELVERPLPIRVSSTSSEDLGTVELGMEEHQVLLQECLQQFDDSLTPEQRHIRKKKPKKSKTKKLKEREELRKKVLLDTVSGGDLDKLHLLLEEFLKLEDQHQKNNFTNQVLDDRGNTLLHVAAMRQQISTLHFLLENEADPCLKNHQQQTAYTCTQSKEVRECLKQFARENPERYNYNKAHIPTSELTLEEQSERKKAQRKVKREKEKVRRRETEVRKQEEADRERFLKLSDREKRALAAERRILDQSGKVLARCFLCAVDITGKVPFEYLGNRFCSVECLKGHRMQHPVL